MEYIFEFISKPWVGSVLGILGFIAAVIFYYRSKRVSRLAFQKDEIAIIGGTGAAFPEEVKISYSSEPVPKVTSSRIILWNAGNTTLGGSQIVDSDKLRLSLPSEGKILKVEILQMTREVNGIVAKRQGEDQNVVEIDFDYLDPRDGACIEILHSGSKGDLEFIGTLRGLPSGLKYYGPSSSSFDRKFRRFPFPFSKSIKLPMLVAAAFGLLITLYAFRVSPIYEFMKKLDNPTTEGSEGPLWIMVFFGIFYTAMPLFVLWIRRRRHPSCLEPKELEKKAEQGSSGNG